MGERERGDGPVEQPGNHASITRVACLYPTTFRMIKECRKKVPWPTIKWVHTKNRRQQLQKSRTTTNTKHRTQNIKQTKSPTTPWHSNVAGRGAYKEEECPQLPYVLVQASSSSESSTFRLGTWLRVQIPVHVALTVWPLHCGQLRRRLRLRLRLLLVYFTLERLWGHTNPIYMQINKIHVELRVAGNKFLSALQQPRRRRHRPANAPPKRGANSRPAKTHRILFGGFILLCYFFASLFAYFHTFSFAAPDAATRCEIVFLMNQMWSADFPLLCSTSLLHTHTGM